MIHAASKFLVATLSAIWSALVWGLHFLAGWALKGAGSVWTRAAQVERLPLPLALALAGGLAFHNLISITQRAVTR